MNRPSTSLIISSIGIIILSFLIISLILWTFVEAGLIDLTTVVSAFAALCIWNILEALAKTKL